MGEVSLNGHRPMSSLESGREMFGVVGRWERTPFVATMNAAGASWYQAAALCLVAAVDAAMVTLLLVAQPRVALSVGPSTLGQLVWLRPLAAAAAAALVVFGQSRNRFPRDLVVRGAAALGGIGILLAGTATSSLAVLSCAALVLGASGASAVVVLPLLLDALRPEVRARMAGAWVASVAAGAGSATVALPIFSGVGLTWRIPFLIAGVAALASAGASARVGNVPVGHMDGRRVRALVEGRLGGDFTEQPADTSLAQLTIGQQLSRVTAPASAASLLMLVATFGAFVWSASAALDVYLRDRWAVVGPARQLAMGVFVLGAVPGALALARRAEIASRRSTGRMVEIGGNAALVAAGALALAAISPFFGLSVALTVLSFAAIGGAMVVGAYGLILLSDPALRGVASGLVAVVAGLGAMLGRQLISTVGDRWGVLWSMLALSALALSAGARARQSMGAADGDLGALIGGMVERYELAGRVARGQHVPLLSCRNIDFSYGQVQVLFDVSLAVDDGEMVALLGTNGAGKSTLLRLISGLALPSSGSVHFRGEDVTYLGTDRRVVLGISQIPGGKAVFGPMTVVDNLRAYGHTHGRDRAEVERNIEATFAALPRLGERRNQLASTLSGGEQQMLALGKAYILRPRLLLIDELSLGLSPKMVGDLLGMVRQINATGTAVVLVEQSVNIALSLVSHAYFMEKGEMHFDGVASELLQRPDLLRSVFLQGAKKGLSAVEHS